MIKMQLINGEHCLLPVMRLFNRVSEHWSWSIWNATLSSVPSKRGCCHLLTKHRSEMQGGSCTGKAHAMGHKLNNSHKKKIPSASFIRLIKPGPNHRRHFVTWTCHKAAVFTCRGCLLPVTLGPSSGRDWSLRAAVGCNLEKKTSIIINNQVFQKPSFQLYTFVILNTTTSSRPRFCPSIDSVYGLRSWPCRTCRCIEVLRVALCSWGAGTG